MNPPSEDIVDILLNNSIGLTYGTDFFRTKMPDQPDQCYCLYDNAGVAPTSQYRLDIPGVQVMGRGDQNSYDTTYAMMEDIKEVMRATQGEVINGTTYIGIWVQSDIGFIGFDEKNRPRFSFNVLIQRTE